MVAGNYYYITNHTHNFLTNKLVFCVEVNDNTCTLRCGVVSYDIDLSTITYNKVNLPPATPEPTPTVEGPAFTAYTWSYTYDAKPKPLEYAQIPGNKIIKNKKGYLYRFGNTNLILWFDMLYGHENDKIQYRLPFSPIRTSSILPEDYYDGDKMPAWSLHAKGSLKYTTCGAKLFHVYLGNPDDDYTLLLLDADVNCDLNYFGDLVNHYNKVQIGNDNFTLGLFRSDYTDAINLSEIVDIDQIK